MASDERERDAIAGIERRDPDEVRREVDARRVRRRLKAAASLVLAAAAGTFLACLGKRDKKPPTHAPNPTKVETSNLPAPPRPDAGSARSDARASQDAGIRPDAGTKGAKVDHGARVDKAEHRKGMPVRDNLLE